MAHREDVLRLGKQARQRERQLRKRQKKLSATRGSRRRFRDGIGREAMCSPCLRRRQSKRSCLCKCSRAWIRSTRADHIARSLGLCVQGPGNAREERGIPRGKREPPFQEGGVHVCRKQELSRESERKRTMVAVVTPTLLTVATPHAVGGAGPAKREKQVIEWKLSKFKLRNARQLWKTSYRD